MSERVGERQTERESVCVCVRRDKIDREREKGRQRNSIIYSIHSTLGTLP